MRATIVLTTLLLAAAATTAPAQADLHVSAVYATAGANPGQLGQPQDVTTDSAGNVCVTNTANARVDEYSPDLTYIKSFGTRGSNPGQLGQPIGVAVAANGEVWVSDFDGSRGRITVYNPDGSLLRTFGSVGTGDGQFRSPGAIALDAAGNAYVGDTSNNRIEKFSPTGTFITKWGTAGPGDGQFQSPRGITVDPSGNVLVADRDNGRVQRFSPDGAFLGRFGTAATKNGLFSSVYDVAAAPSGDLFTADNNLFDIEKFKNDGTFLFQATGANTFDSSPAKGLRPVSVAVDPHGVVYATGTSPPFVVKFDQIAPQPVLAQKATAAVVKGAVRVRLPGAAAFTALTKDPASIPIGSTLDTTKGTIKLVTAGTGATIQKGSFNGGQFRLLQPKSGKGLTDIVMLGGNLNRCSAKKAGAAAKRGRQLFTDAHGRFRTRGRYSSATVRGTRFLTKDTCAGTVTKVSRGTVLVRDLVKKRNFKVTAGHSYLAKPKRPLH
jgi:streptogramin lyase